VIASNDQNEVVVVYRQRGVSPAGERIDTEVIALYKIRDGKLARAQMFHFEETATAAFLGIAAQQLKGESGVNVG
jgi:ketosteroid isomerase-like protein